MSASSLILFFLASGGMWTLFIAVVLIWKYADKNLLNNLLILMASLWFSYGAWFLVRHYFMGYSYNNRLIALDRVAWGMVMALATASYPITAICKEWLRNRIFKIFIFAPLLVFAVYLGYWMSTGKGFEEYSTYEELSGHWTDIAVILRLIIWLISISYNLIALYLILRAAPIYENYIENTYSDLEYNLRWIKVIAAFFIGNMLVYTLNVFWFDWWTRLMFIFVSFPLWVFMMEQGIFRKSFTPADDFIIRWSWKKGWHEVYFEKEEDTAELVDSAISPVLEADSRQSVKVASASNLCDITARLEEYMVNDQPYTDSGLTRETFAKALGTNRTTLLLAIKDLGYDSFQDYINKHRIYHFKKLAGINPSESIVKLYLQSGFVTKSTFYRYFKETEGMLPGEYMARLIKDV